MWGWHLPASYLLATALCGAMWPRALVLATVVLAGCAGFIGDAGDPDESLTAAPVPATETSVPLPTRDGRVDVSRLLARHDTALRERSYHRSLRREGPENNRDVWVDRDGGVVRVRQTFGPLVNDVVVTDGTEYANVQDDPTRNYVTRPNNGTVPYVTSLSGRAVLAQVLTAASYERVGEVQRGGRSLAVVVGRSSTLQGTAEPPRGHVIVSRLYVDRSGIVRRVEHRARRPDGSRLSVEMTVRTGLDRVPVPWWLDAADPYASASGST